MHTSVLEDFVNSLEPKPFDLADFLIHVAQVPQFSEAPVRSVDCHRRGVHDYLILSCEVTMPSTGRASIVWFRLERNPSSKSIGMFSGKPSAAVDTVRAHRDLKLIHKPCDSRGHFVYHTTDTPPTTLRLQHIFDMYKYLAQRSSTYAMYKTNCRWLCFGLFECLRDCQPCYGGHWMGSKATSWNDDDSAVEAKNLYLKELHPTCCFPAQRPISVLRALVVESSEIAAAAAAVVGRMDHVVNNLPNATDHTASHFTDNPPTPTSPPASAPPINQPAANHTAPQGSRPYNTQTRYPTQYQEGQPAMDRRNTTQSTGGHHHSYQPHAHPGSRPVPRSQYPQGTPQVPLPQPSFDAHAGYSQYPGTQRPNNAGRYPPGRGTRAGNVEPCTCGGHDVYGCQAIPTPAPVPTHPPAPAPTQSYHECGSQCQHQHSVPPQQYSPHESQPQQNPYPQYQPQPQPQPQHQPRPYPPSHSNTYSYPPPPASATYSSPPEGAYDIPTHHAGMHRSSMHIPPSDQSHFTPQNNQGPPQRGPTHARAPSSHRTSYIYHNHQSPQPAPAPQAPPGQGFAHQTFAHGQAPGSGFMGGGAPDYSHHNPSYVTPQPQPAQPFRSFWGSETSEMPLRTESPSRMETLVEGAIPNRDSRVWIPNQHGVCVRATGDGRM
ncbi:hypothetical protein BDV93DRAFT_566897 [Ceratobasidium sp. AG-I]|nr:hypothetical protein BDV93DRAFT_566897 [Ceratobasidium sp. AG-I]